MFGSWIMGTPILDYQLIPPFWKGDFRTAYVNSPFENNNQAVVSLIMPYLRDIVFVIPGFLILKRKGINNYFLTGLVLIVFILSPLYDVINNYSAFVFMSYGDFNGISKIIGAVYTNAIGLLFTLTALFITFRIFKIYKDFPLL
jgi:hypothetical protein